MLNAVIDLRFEKAVEEAKAIDKKIRNGEYTEQDFKKKPFLGIVHQIYLKIKLLVSNLI